MHAQEMKSRLTGTCPDKVGVSKKREGVRGDKENEKIAVFELVAKRGAWMWRTYQGA